MRIAAAPRQLKNIAALPHLNKMILNQNQRPKTRKYGHAGTGGYHKFGTPVREVKANIRRRIQRRKSDPDLEEVYLEGEKFRALIAHPLLAPPPCFFFGKCRAASVCCKQGKAVCEACAATLPGQRLPLPDPRD